MSHYMDAFGHVTRQSLQQLANKDLNQRVNSLVEAVGELHSEVRTLEMMRSHYLLQAHQYAQESVQSMDFSIRLRQQSAATAYHQIAEDLDNRIRALKSGAAKIALAIG